MRKREERVSNKVIKMNKNIRMQSMINDAERHPDEKMVKASERFHRPSWYQIAKEREKNANEVQ